MSFLGTNIALLRNRTGLSSEQLATRLNVGTTTIRNIETGYITSPSPELIKEIAKVFDTTVEGLLGLKPLEIAERARMVYIVDSIDAKCPLVELDKVIGCVFIDRDKLRGYEHFGLKVKGNAMVNRRILSGDVVIVRKNAVVKNDDIVAVAVENCPEVIIRTYRKENENILLKAENDSDFYKDIRVKESDSSFKLIGKVIKCEFDL